MAQIANKISLYRQMTKQMAKEAGMRIAQPVFSYYLDDEEKEIKLDDNFEGILTVNKFDSMWSPSEHDLEITQQFTFEKPSVLYGKDGITMSKNLIGLAVHVHSKTSSFQKTVSIGSIPNHQTSIAVEFNESFNVSSLRGNIELDFFLYLQNYQEYNPIQASRVGMILSEGNIENLTIVVDGEGSVFPMSEFEDKNGPLWRLDKNWIEPNLDTFDSSYVNLSFNIAHPLFEQVKSGKTKVSRAMMDDVMVQAMSSIIQEVVIIQGYSLEDVSDALSGSILKAVEYWVSTFNVDTSSLFSISNTIREYWDNQMLKGDVSDD